MMQNTNWRMSKSAKYENLNIRELSEQTENVMQQSEGALG